MFYCTAGRGTEVFVAEELSSRLIDKDAFVTDGKVYFRCNPKSFCDLNKLKSVERVFVQVEYCKTSELNIKDRHDLLRCLKEKLTQKKKLEDVFETYRTVTHCGGNTDSDIEEPVLKRRREDTDCEVDCPTFRVSSKVAGRWGRAFRGRDSREVSQVLGREIVRQLGWRVELRNPELEICVHVNDESVCAGIPISRQPVSKRHYIVQPGLRSTVSWIIGHLANIKAGDVVLDPMCGKATILVEACMEHMSGQYLGLDINPDQLKSAGENRKSAKLEEVLTLGLADVTRLPLRDNCVDKVLCDAPFGQKHNVNMNMSQFYRMLLHQIYRVLRPGGTCVLMTSSELKETLQKTVAKLNTPTVNWPQSLGGQDDNESAKDKIESDNKAEVYQPRSQTEQEVIHPESMSTGSTRATLSNEQDDDNRGNSDYITADEKCSQTNDLKDYGEAVVLKDKSDLNQIEKDCANQTSLDVTSLPSNDEPCLSVCSEHYIKLGETHAYIFVLKKTN